MKFLLIILMVSFIASLLLTHWVRGYALHKAIMDVPNARSSHAVPIPRGGGLAFVVVFLLATILLFLYDNLPGSLMLTLVGGGILVAAIGYCDDIKSIGARWRSLVHLFVAIWAVYWLNGFQILDFGAAKVHGGWLGSLFAVIAIIWCINLYNFMDGIDGFAGSEGIFTSICGAVFLWLSGDHSLATLCLILAMAITGFLFWNWPPAKIFMGDVGSGFLGFVFAVIVLASVKKHESTLIFWGLLFAIFLYDATLTLIYRLYRKQVWYHAHREHAYQKLTDYGMSHGKVVLAMLAVNLLILLPAASIVWLWPQQSFWVLGIISMGLIALWIWSRFLRKRPCKSRLILSE